MSNTAIQQLPADHVGSLAPRNLQEAMEFSKLMSQSAIVPKDYQGKPANVLVAVQWGMELGLAPMQAMQNIAVINGRPSIWGDAMLAICQAHPQFQGIDEQVDDTRATCTVKRNGRTVTQTFTMEDAKRAGLAGKQGPWSQYPKRMLQMRARSFALRDAFADALKGIQSAEEVQDMPTERDMGTVYADTTPTESRTQSVKEKLKAKQAETQPAQPAELIEPETGELIPAPTYDEVIAALGNCKTPELFAEIRDTARSIYDDCSKEEKAMLTKSIKALEEEFGE